MKNLRRISSVVSFILSRFARSSFILILALMVLPALAQAGQAPLSPGWDIFDGPLVSGRVEWNVLDNGSLTVSYELNGASPNHKYIVGAHFFDPGNAGNLPGVCEFGGWKVGCDRSTISREGVSATVIGAWDFGYVTTNARGNGRAQFHLNPPAGTYHVQFTVRIGDKCDPSSGQTGGCGAAYRTGSKMGHGLEVITISGGRGHQALLSPGWDIFDRPLVSGSVNWDAADDDSLTVSFELNGASPNHKYIVGAHFFDPGNAGNLPNVCEFGGWKVGCDRSTISREGVNGTVIGAWDFGYLTTNARGNGRARFKLNPPAGTYHVQFTVRIGDKCEPASGQTSGCGAVYRTGSKMGQGLEVITIAGGGRGQQADLTPGWDIFNGPLANGKVKWDVLQDGRLELAYELIGASPNHKYIVGAHFFDPGNAGNLASVCKFDGWKVGCDRSTISREGVSATVIGAWDFGYVTTNARGNARAHFKLTPPTGTYYVQFTVRIGDKCDPASGQTGGCGAVYRTGSKMGRGLNVITIPW